MNGINTQNAGSTILLYTKALHHAACRKSEKAKIMNDIFFRIISR